MVRGRERKDSKPWCCCDWEEMLLSAELKSDRADRDRRRGEAKKEEDLWCCMLHLDAGWGPGWQKYGGRGTLVIPMKSFSKAAEESEGCTEKDEIL